jgi:hypothetical protein
VPEAIEIQGLAEFRKGLLAIEADWSATEGLKRVGDEAAQLIVDWVRPRIERKTGTAARSVTASSTQTAARVTGGGKRAPWYPWLDFGGRVGRKRSVHRPFDAGGRYIYPGFDAVRPEVTKALTEGLVRTIHKVGWDVGESSGG